MKKAQSLVEFAIVLAVFLLVVMAIIDYSMLNRARWQIETIANEVMANVQLEDRSVCKDKIKEEFIRRLKLVYPTDINFDCEETDSYVHCTSDALTRGEPKFIYNANCPTSEGELISFYIQYNYSGFLVLNRVHHIISAVNSSAPKF